MKRVVLFCFLALLSGTLYAQQNYAVEQVLFLPPEHYAGDRVEVRITLNVDSGVRVGPTESLPQNERTVVHDVEIRRQNGTVEVWVSFSSFVVGVQTLPPMVLGDINLRDVSFQTNSIIEENGGAEAVPFEEIREQALLPGTNLLILSVASGFVVLFLLLLPGQRVVRKLITRTLRRTKERRRYSIFVRTIEKLKKEASAIDANAFYSKLCSELKRYFSMRFGEDYLVQTTTEMKPRLDARLQDICPGSPVSELFTFGDRVKFGGYPAAVEKRLDDIALINDTVQEIERVRRGHVEL